MARLARVVVPGVAHHVTQRGNRRQPTFFQEEDYSGSLGANQSNWLQTTVTGPGTFSFWWEAASSDTGSVLTFSIDGTAREAIYGDQTTWEQHTYTITGSGTHTLKWTFSRSSDEGHSGAGYVDSVQWTGSAAPAPEPPVNAWHRLAYTYDAFGRRIAKSYNEELITSYVYDGDHCLAEYDLNGNLKRKYIFGPCVDEPICMIEAGSSYAGTYYYHFDALGSVVALTNSSGNTVEVYEYSVFGQVGSSDPNHPNRFMFTGREFDKETGLYYYRARYYNPQIGRFLQTDPIGYKDGVNWYAYCRNDPVCCIDPTGRYRWEDPNTHRVVYEGPVHNLPTYVEVPVLVGNYGPQPTIKVPTMADYHGGAYTIQNFLQWYRWGGGEGLHFYSLSDPFCKAFAESGQISASVEAFKEQVRAHLAVKASLLAKDLGPRGFEKGYIGGKEFDFHYNFASPFRFLTDAVTNDNGLFVLGHGTLTMQAAYTVCADGSYSVNFSFDVHDAFHDVYCNEEHGPHDDTHAGWWQDCDDCTPFEIYIDWFQSETVGKVPD